jgi:hypothetical protein
VEDEIVELKNRLAELTAAVDALLARQLTENQRADDGPADPAAAPA